MDNVVKQELNLRDLDTKSVTLFPSRAQIVREVKDLQLAVSISLPHSAKLQTHRGNDSNH